MFCGTDHWGNFWLLIGKVFGAKLVIPLVFQDQTFMAFLRLNLQTPFYSLWYVSAIKVVFGKETTLP